MEHSSSFAIHSSPFRHPIGGDAMTTFIMLATWTDQGIRSVKESPNRLDASKKLLSNLGGEMKSFWLTMGGHDMVRCL
jgi:uncharacterized protein with GYD domain